MHARTSLVRRGFRLAGLTVGLVGLFVAVTAVPGAATPPDRFAPQLVGRGTYVDHGTLPLGQDLDIVTVKVVVPPGGSSGWHSHPGGAIVIIYKGEITTYRSVGNQCVVTTHTHGQSFIERPGQPLYAVNTGSVDTVIVATFPGVPVNGSARTDLPDPGTCPGI